VLGREFLQNGFRTAEDLEARTGRPVLGQIPRIPARARADTIQYLLTKPTSAAAEAVRNLRTSLVLSNLDRPPRVIMATSSVPNEGKTTLAIALAQNLAGLDKKVLLVEGDIRRRTFNAYFPNGTGKGGLLTVVSGKQTLEAAVFRPEGFGVDVLMGERSSVNAADVFSSDSFRRFVEHARAAYDYVIIDTPPVLVVPDARVIAQHVDALVYVVQWDATSHSQVEEGLRQFRSVNAPVAGLVLSRIDPRGMKRYGYGGRYGPYSRYGRKYYEA
jgi:capsular exopolysaccharide synthesis family protein